MSLEYPLKDILVDEQGRSPVYEEFKEKMKQESLRKPIKDLEKVDYFSGEPPKEILTPEVDLANDKKILDRFEEKGLISIKTLVMKNPDQRSK